MSGLFTVVRGRKVHGGFWVAASEPGLREQKRDLVGMQQANVEIEV